MGFYLKNDIELGNNRTLIFFTGFLVWFCLAIFAIRFFLFNGLMFGFHWDHSLPVYPLEDSNFLARYNIPFNFSIFPGSSNVYNINPVPAYFFYGIMAMVGNQVYNNDAFFLLCSGLAYFSCYFLLINMGRAQNQFTIVLLSLLYAFSPAFFGFFSSGSYPVVLSISIFPLLIAWILLAIKTKNFVFIYLLLICGSFITIHYFLFLFPFVIWVLVTKFSIKRRVYSFLLFASIYGYVYFYPIVNNPVVLEHKRVLSFDAQSLFHVFSLTAFTHNLFQIISSPFYTGLFALLFYCYLLVALLLRWEKLSPFAWLSILGFLLVAIPYTGINSGHNGLMTTINEILFHDGHGLYFVHRSTTAFSILFIAFFILMAYYVLPRSKISIIFLSLFILSLLLPNIIPGDLNARKYNVFGKQKGYLENGLNVLQESPTTYAARNLNKLIPEPSIIFEMPPAFSAFFPPGSFLYMSQGSDPSWMNTHNQFIDYATTPALVKEFYQKIINDDISGFQNICHKNAVRYVVIRHDKMHPLFQKRYSSKFINMAQQDNIAFIKIFSDNFMDIFKVLGAQNFFSGFGIDKETLNGIQKLLKNNNFEVNLSSFSFLGKDIVKKSKYVFDTYSFYGTICSPGANDYAVLFLRQNVNPAALNIYGEGKKIISFKFRSDEGYLFPAWIVKLDSNGELKFSVRYKTVVMILRLLSFVVQSLILFYLVFYFFRYATVNAKNEFFKRCND